MYCKFFGFSEKPFDVTPDPKFLYLTPGHREALSALLYGIRERKGFVVLVGEVGTGKTTLLNALLHRLDKKTRAAFIFNTDICFDEMLNMALVDLGLTKPDRPLAKVEALHRLNDFATQQLAKGGNVVLLVDEAQNLDRPSLENLRLLSNLETRKHKLIQIVLSGQPELDQKLGQPELRQLVQRISIKRYITPLGEKDTYKYMEHRLNIAGYAGPPLFARKVRHLIWEFSGGVPRKINVLCDNSLLIGFAMREKSIKSNVITEAMNDLTWSPFSSSREAQTPPLIQRTAQPRQKTSGSWFPRAAGLGIAAVFLFVVSLLLGRHWFNSSETGLAPIPTATRVEATNQLAPTAPLLVSEMPDDQPVVIEQSETGQEMALSGIPQETEPLGNLTNSTNKTNSTNSTNSTNRTIDVAPDARETRVVIVKQGDSLSKIINRAYGRYDRTILNAVLQENPEIENPNQIEVGQEIKMPAE